MWEVGRTACNLGCTPGPDARASLYACRVSRVTILLAVLACLAFAAPAGADARRQAVVPVAVEPVVTTAQEEPTETTPAQDDPDEEEIGEDIEPSPEQGEEPEEEESAPAPAPAPVATPAPAELPRTGTDHRPLLAAAALVLMGLALRRVTRPG
jgi:hypothetical protein